MSFKFSDSTLFNSHPFPVVIFHCVSEKIIEVNPAANQWFGFDQVSFKKITLPDLLTSDPTLRVYVEEIPSSQESENYKIAIFKETEHRDKQTVEQMKFEELYYHLKNTPFGIIEWDEEFNLRSISPQITEMSGYRLTDVMGANVLDLVQRIALETESGTIKKVVQELLDGTTSRNSFDLKYIKPDGTISFARYYNSALQDTEGRLISVFSIVEDLTEKEVTKNALDKQNRIFKLFADNSTDVISRHNADGDYIYVSPSIEDLAGYKPEKLIGKNVYNYFHPQDLETIREGHFDILTTTNDRKLTYRFRKKDGEYIWLETISKSLRESDTQEVIEIQATTRDISDRIVLESRLKAEKNLLKTAIESLPGIFYMLDENQKYVMWNKSFEKTLGVSRQEVKNLHPLEFYRKEDHALITNKIKQAFTKGEARIEIDLINRDGEAIPHHITGKVFKNDGKNYIVGAGINISDRVAYEKELHDSLKEKQVLLQEIHHRVKNNLAIVSALMEIQKMQYHSPDIHRILSNSQLRIKSMALVHEKLYQSQSMSKIRLDEIIKDVARLNMEVMDLEDRVTIHTDNVSPITLNVNQAIPCALITNELISNAFEHAFRDVDKGTLQVSLQSDDGRVDISVKDNGTGIPKSSGSAVDSFGYTIINTLVDQLDGELAFKTDRGTEINLSFIEMELTGSSSGILW